MTRGAPLQPEPTSNPSAPPLWARPGLLASFIAIALVYGSLIPFDFAWSDAVATRGGATAVLLDAAAAPRWVSAAPGRSSLGLPFWVSDLLANIALYAPLGVTLRMALRPRVRSDAAQVALVGFAALALSWAIEALQSLVPMRVASRNDFVANVAGALIAALLAPLVWHVYRRLAFACYCRCARPVAALRRYRDKPGVVMLLAALNAGVIGLWYLGELGRSGMHSAGSALPFEHAFHLPYDLGVLVLGRALLVYAGIGCLLLLLTYTGARRLAMNWVVLGIVLLALAAELSRTATHNAMPDLTGSLLALTAGALMTVTVYTFSLAVKASNRRRQAQPFDGPDRRRAPHDYA